MNQGNWGEGSASLSHLFTVLGKKRLVGEVEANTLAGNIW